MTLANAHGARAMDTGLQPAQRRIIGNVVTPFPVGERGRSCGSERRGRSSVMGVRRRPYQITGKERKGFFSKHFSIHNDLLTTKKVLDKTNFNGLVPHVLLSC